MDYVTLTEDEIERISFETVHTLPVDQFEEAVGDEAIALDEAQLRALLHTYEADHLRASIRAKVAPDFPAPAGMPPAHNPAQTEELERRIAVLKQRLSL